MADQGEELRDRVRYERRVRGWSVRAASVYGGFSNTLWGQFESGGPVTATVRNGIARAFEGNSDWPESPPARPETRATAEARLSALETRMLLLEEQIELMSQELYGSPRS